MQNTHHYRKYNQLRYINALTFLILDFYAMQVTSTPFYQCIFLNRFIGDCLSNKTSLISST